MNFIHKFRLFSFYIIICLWNIITQTNDTDLINARDEYGRTPLMNFIQEHDVELADLRKKVWFILDCDITCDKNGKIIHAIMHTRTDRWDIDQKCFDEQIQHWDPYKIKYDFIIKKIKKMIALGANLTLYDNTGKTVLHYCYTKEIYNFLCNNGATFQIAPWIYFNSYKIFMASFMCCGLTIIALKQYQDHKNREFIRNLRWINPYEL